MNKFKQLFCKHEYKFYSDTSIHSFTSTSTVKGYKYICPKCGKETTLSSFDLSNEINELKEHIRKKKVLEEDISELDDNSEFIMRTFNNSCPQLYSGKHIHELKMKYKKCGIDLDEITQWYRQRY